MSEGRTMLVRDTINGDGSDHTVDMDGYWSLLMAASDTLRREGEGRMVMMTREDGVTIISRGQVMIDMVTETEGGNAE